MKNPYSEIIRVDIYENRDLGMIHPSILTSMFIDGHSFQSAAEKYFYSKKEGVRVACKAMIVTLAIMIITVFAMFYGFKEGRYIIPIITAGLIMIPFVIPIYYTRVPVANLREYIEKYSEFLCEIGLSPNEIMELNDKELRNLCRDKLKKQVDKLTNWYNSPETKARESSIMRRIHGRFLAVGMAKESWSSYFATKKRV